MFLDADLSATKVSVTKNTGLFKGSFKVQNGRSFTTYSFEGAWVQGLDLLEGFFLKKESGQYADPKTGVTRSYSYNDSYRIGF